MILRHLRPAEWGLVAVSVALVFAQVYLDLSIPDYMSAITTIITTGGTVEMVLEEGLGMLACAFGSLAASVATGLMAARVAASLSRRLREMEFERVQSFSPDQIDGFSTASLITRSTNDITQIQMAVAMGLQVIVKAPILAVWAILKISDKSWQWSASTAVAVLALMVVIGVVMYFVVPRFRRIQWLTDNVNRVTRENLTGIRVVRAYNAEEYQERKFDAANNELTDNNLSANRAMSVMMPAMTSVMSLLSLSVYWIGAYLISSAGDPASRMALFSDMVVFSAYAMQVVMAFVMLVVIFMILPRAAVAAKRVEEIIDTEPAMRDGPVTEAPGDARGEVEFRNVCFRYTEASEYVLRDISFRAGKGETVAFIGSTGSGKSTLVNLVPRFYDVTEGQVLLDGVDVRDYTQEALRRKIGYVPQTASILSGTISSNVRYGDSADVGEEGVRNALAIAQADGFVGEMERGLEAPVAQGGSNLSGGQKQRLSIARAVFRRPEVYIFDDSFSALDFRTDRALRQALRKETGGTTSLIVAQRIGAVMDADRIIVLDDGRMVGMGRHEELMRDCEVYREIACSQLSGEELRA
ncbi:MAG: ABC transporter ATP-binding protein [Candidatus Methanomethylophilaceae archaeon]|jgi:ATP-binding cassette subfamily B protein|nr:ABC transporter ATP-binding protein [Candidatus Methanomethylophilaceae archaeon]